MSNPFPLQIDTFISPPIKIETGLPDPAKQWWQPLTTTLIHSLTSAVLIDPPMTIAQSEIVADWIDSILSLYTPGTKRLRYIYITHAHGDHFFGTPVIAKRFPGVEVLATQAVLEGIEVQYSPDVYDGVWGKWFPNGQLWSGDKTMPTALPLSNEFLVDGQLFKAYDVSSDCERSSFLHVPSIKTIVAGDVVYGDCHQHLREANIPEKRQRWLDALDLIDDLQPNIVVPGHKRASQSDGAYLIAATRRYIEDFAQWGDEIRKDDSLEAARKPDALFDRLKKEYPNRWNDFLLMGGTMSFFE